MKLEEIVYLDFKDDIDINKLIKALNEMKEIEYEDSVKP